MRYRITLTLTTAPRLIHHQLAVFDLEARIDWCTLTDWHDRLSNILLGTRRGCQFWRAWHIWLPPERRQRHNSPQQGILRLRKPVPPQPRYGLRRALVLGGVLLILLLLIVTIVVGYLWARNTIRTQDEERAAAQVHTVYPTPGKCDPSTLKSTVQGPESVGVGAGATFSISLVNSGQAPCLIDVGSQALGVRVTSGSQQVWDSLTCPVGQTEKALLLPAGKGAEVTVKHVPQVVTVLNEEGVVETVLDTVLFESFGGRGLAQCRVGRVDRRQRHDEEDEEGHADHHDRQGH